MSKSLDALEASAEGYVTHHYTYPCRQARIDEVVRWARILGSQLRFCHAWDDPSIREAGEKLQFALDIYEGKHD